VDKPNVSVLIVSLLQPLLWLVGVWLTVTYKNWFAFIGCFVSLLCSIPIAFELAGYSPPGWIVSMASYLGTTAVMFLVAGIAYSARAYRMVREWAEDLPHRFER